MSSLQARARASEVPVYRPIKPPRRLPLSVRFNGQLLNFSLFTPAPSIGPKLLAPRPFHSSTAYLEELIESLLLAENCNSD